MPTVGERLSERLGQRRRGCQHVGPWLSSRVIRAKYSAAPERVRCRTSRCSGPRRQYAQWVIDSWRGQPSAGRCENLERVI
jgi:hypothetical protein